MRTTIHVPELVVNSMSLALTDLTNESEIIIGVYAKSHPYLHSIKSVNFTVHENNILKSRQDQSIDTTVYTTSNNDMKNTIV